MDRQKDLHRIKSIAPEIILNDLGIPFVKRRCFKVIVEDVGEEIIAVTLLFDRILGRKGLCK